MKISITASEYEKESIIYIHKYWNEMQYGRLIPIIKDIYGHDLIYLQRFLIFIDNRIESNIPSSIYI